MRFRRTRHVDVSVESAIGTWAAQWRLMTQGEQSIPSLLGRLKDQGPAAGESGKRGQRWAEVYTGDGFIVQRIMAGMSETPRLVVQVHYLHIGRVSDRTTWLAISKTQYWAELDKGEEAIQSGLKLLEKSPDEAKPMFQAM